MTKTYNVDFDRCAYNNGVDCEQHDKCYKCGFKPAVHQKRIKVIRAELRLGIYGKEKRKERETDNG